MSKPTDSELAILQILWDKGEASVKEVHQALNADRADEKAYTTTLKILQIMLDKGLVEREAQGRKHIYQPSSQKKETQKQLIHDLLLSAFKGSTSALVMQALGSSDTSEEELEEIKALIEKMQKTRK